MCGLPSNESLCKVCENELAIQQWWKEEDEFHDDPNALVKEQHLVALEELKREMD
jgi:hypothetical protein